MVKAPATSIRLLFEMARFAVLKITVVFICLALEFAAKLVRKFNESKNIRS